MTSSTAYGHSLAADRSSSRCRNGFRSNSLHLLEPVKDEPTVLPLLAELGVLARLLHRTRLEAEVDGQVARHGPAEVVVDDSEEND